jgi:hypothetical protein
MTWKPIDTAPKDRPILIKADNGEYHVAQWSSHSEDYPWQGDYTAYPTDRIVGWRPIDD